MQKKHVNQASRREATSRYMSQPGVVLRFADSLEVYRKWRAGQEPAANLAGATVTLVGHSMGCIVMKNMLQESLLQPKERRLQLLQLRPQHPPHHLLQRHLVVEKISIHSCSWNHPRHRVH